MLDNTKTLMLVLDRIYECTIWDEDTVFNVLNFCGDGFSLNPMQSFQVMYMTCNINSIYVYSKTFYLCRFYIWTVPPNYLATKIIKVSICIGRCLL